MLPTLSRRTALLVVVTLICIFPRTFLDAQPGQRTSPAVVTILHFNDVYEIQPTQAGHSGGLARVATVLQQLKRTHPPVLSVLAGDYLSPSAIGTAVVDGEPLGGRQMVDVLNAVGLDWATFGNHEFDPPHDAFLARNAQSRFHIVSSNVTDVAGNPFPKTVRTAIVPMRAGSRTIRIGLLGLTIDSNRQPWVRYAEPIAAAQAAMRELDGHVDAVIAITHQALADDAQLVTQVSGIDLVLGGHEHENWMIRRGGAMTPIVKADANVRTVAIVSLNFPRLGGRPSIASRLQVIDDRIVPDPAVAAVADRWTKTAFDAFRRNGFTPERVVAVTTAPLDGREATVRNRPGLLTDIIAAGFARDAGTTIGILNGGSVRIDDVIPPGPITEYDTIRILPFGGRVARATLDGVLLANVLDTGVRNQGAGGYLQTVGVTREGDRWVVDGKPLDPGARYRVAVTDFLLTGREANLGFFTPANPGVHDVENLDDVRMAFMNELRARYPGGR